MPEIDYFAIIAEEICTKQNGIDLKRGDDTLLKDVFIRRGGDVKALTQGVLPEFDRLKSVIVDTYQAGKIAVGHRRFVRIAVDVESIQKEQDFGVETALKIAAEVLGDDVLNAVLKAKTL